MFETELQRVGQLISWVIVLLGLWVMVTPWFWGGGAGFFGGDRIAINWLFWSNTIAGLVIAGLSVYTSLQIQQEIRTG
jgi:hypothetical protein